MRWALQVAQVARKDLKQVRWMFGLFLLGIGMSAWGIVSGSSFGPYQTSETTVVIGMPTMYSAFLPTFVSLLGIGIAATLVQLDSPSRPNTFWATRPIAPSAVLTSKLLLILVGLVGAAVVGAGIAMWAMDASMTSMVRALVQSTLSAVRWVLLVLVVAGITRDIREFVAGMVALIILLLMVGMMMPDIAMALSRPFAVAMTLVSIVSALIFVARLYRTRERTNSTAGIALAIAACLVLASFMPDNSLFAANSGTQTVAPVTPLKVLTTQFLPADSDNYTLRMSLAAPVQSDSVRFDFAPELVTLKGNAGETRVELAYGMEHQPVVLAGTMPWVGRSVKWLGQDTLALASFSSLWSKRKFKSADTAQYAGAVSKVRGTLTMSRPRILANMPLRQGATVVVDGYRVNIYGGVQHDTTARVWIQLATINPPDLIPRTMYSNFGGIALQFALLNEQRGEAIQLNASNSTGTGGYVVMPQMSITSTYAQFTTGSPFYGRTKIPLDDTWYADARLVVMEWVRAGKFSLEAEGVVR